ncbi:MAG: hypothetical protein RBR67_13710 [Desulfobacterium sp.]|nr:hypothetical protein [Desulfobacterium sp.]
MAISGFLKEVKELKQREVAHLRSKTDMGRLRAQAERRKTPGDFLKAMVQSTPDRVGIIAEIKKASPSKGLIRPDLDPVELARLYTRGGASAISVLTESNFFKGSLDDLTAVRGATTLPVLRKDFIFSEFQIYEARAAGADSVLLITPLMEPGELRDYIALARELAMEPLVEINSTGQFETALKAGATIIGINNRNLETLETDPDLARRIAPVFTGGSVFSKDMVCVAASTISSRRDIKGGIDAGIFNFLVGESIVRAPDTESFIRELRGEKTGEKPQEKYGEDYGKLSLETSQRHSREKPLVKICGLTDPLEAVQCQTLGAEAIGLVFFEKSPRNLLIDQARKITLALLPETITVGVFVNADYDYIMERVEACRLKAVQLHGQESPELVSRLARTIVGSDTGSCIGSDISLGRKPKTDSGTRSCLRVIKALFAEHKPGFDTAGAYRDAWALLVEDGRGTLPGGNARSWEWDRAGKMNRDPNLWLILAGGLDPANVRQAVTSVRPDMVDVSSGVELSPGKKDLTLVEKFILAARGK